MPILPPIITIPPINLDLIKPGTQPTSPNTTLSPVAYSFKYPYGKNFENAPTLNDLFALQMRIPYGEVISSVYINNIIRHRSTDTKRILLQMLAKYAYALIVLAKNGYIHGDPHNDNYIQNISNEF